ncbi:MAG: MBL fold metallo-hydrolase [Verrucomicrobia bacterium]|nr:MBL fold metallo-hydrolase [Verrucomicrobiota bacterium]
MIEPSSARVKSGFEWTRGIHVIEAALADRILRIFLLTGIDRVLLIDTGVDSTMGDRLVPYLREIGLPPSRISYVLISHADFDHQGGISSARKLLSEPTFFCHSEDAPLIESAPCLIEKRYSQFRNEHGIDDSPETKEWIRANCGVDAPVDVLLSGGEEVRLEPDWAVRVLHTPGHTKGHLSIWDRRSKTAIIADAALGSYLPTSDNRPAFPPTYRHVNSYRSTIRALMDLKAEAMLTSHYPLMEGGEADNFLSESIAFTERLDGELQRTLQSAGSPRSTRELIADLSPRLGQWPDSAAALLAYPLMGHLELLESLGAVCRVAGHPFVKWTWMG